MLTCDQALERISAQLDNELTDREEALLEEHLQGCAACRALQTDFQALHTALQESAAAWTAEPPAALAQDVMAAVRAAKVTPFQSKRQAWRRRSWACAGPYAGIFRMRALAAATHGNHLRLRAFCNRLFRAPCLNWSVALCGATV